jgi:adenosylcobinamide kinase / adenosylcobinamide-phosphate guanylyltransferase
MQGWCRQNNARKIGEVYEDMQVVLVLGGARSGKSTFAERLAEQSGHRVAYIATAIAGDADMQERINRHRAARPSAWSTFEEPLLLADAVREAANVADVIILDCLTTWLSNWFFAREDGPYPESDEFMISAQHYDSVLGEIDALLQTAASLPIGEETNKTLLIVSNEVGLGIVPAYALGRVYRDVLGLVNQRIAAQAKRVYLMVAGLGVDIKRLHEDARL